LWGAGIIVLALAVRAGFRFPWYETVTAIQHADQGALLALAVISLLCFVAKGWAWHLLLRPVAPHRWRSAQDANLVGAAINNVSVAVIGEAARVRRLLALAPVPMGAAVASVVWTRAIEAVGLAICVLVAPLLLDLPPIFRGLEIGALASLIGLISLVVWFRRGGKLPFRIPDQARRAVAILGQIGPWPRLVAPVFLALVNWAGQWASMHYAFVAAGFTAPAAASFLVMLATNLTGLLRLTPGNVGAMQAGFVAGLLPFGVAAGPAIGASLLLQAAQIIPVMVIAFALVGWNGMRDLVRRSRTDVGRTAG
jgi:uncharacterized membrane protein YbhN (UPF0104 family)